MQIKPKTPKHTPRQANHSHQDRLSLIGEAIIILSLPSALPLPTAGIAHSLGLLIIVFAFWGLILGGVSDKTHQKFQKGRDKILKFKKLKSFHDRLWEYANRHLKDRRGWLYNNRYFRILTGLLIITSTLCFFTILPLGDTAPSLAVIAFGFSLVYKDIFVWWLGVFLSILGVFINIGSLSLVLAAILKVISGHF